MTYTIDCSKGVALSLAPATHVDEVIQGIFILLNTYIGEVPCFREFGIDPSYRDKPIPIAKALYASAITEGIEKYISGVTVDQITFSHKSDDMSTLLPKVEVTIIEQD